MGGDHYMPPGGNGPMPADMMTMPEGGNGPNHMPANMMTMGGDDNMPMGGMGPNHDDGMMSTMGGDLPVGGMGPEQTNENDNMPLGSHFMPKGDSMMTMGDHMPSGGMGPHNNDGMMTTMGDHFMPSGGMGPHHNNDMTMTKGAHTFFAQKKDHMKHYCEAKETVAFFDGCDGLQSSDCMECGKAANEVAEGCYADSC